MGWVSWPDNVVPPFGVGALLAPVRKCCPIPASRKEPSHEVHCGNGHANTEQDSGKDPLRPAFSKGERQTRNHNRNHGNSPCAVTRKSLFQHANRPFPLRT